jgi:hypothetical protein
LNRVYIAGPMTGIPQFNFPAFDACAAWLRGDGYDVVSPAELDDAETRAAAMASKHGFIEDMRGHGTWGDFLARDVKMMADDGIEGIVVLPGWDKSKGARVETFVGNAVCGLPVYLWNPGRAYITPVSKLALARAWLQEQDISFNPKFGGTPQW